MMALFVQIAGLRLNSYFRNSSGYLTNGKSMNMVSSGVFTENVGFCRDLDI